MITSGSIFVSDEDESGIKRWKDVFFWSPSMILGLSRDQETWRGSRDTGALATTAIRAAIPPAEVAPLRPNLRARRLVVPAGRPPGWGRKSALMAFVEKFICVTFLPTWSRGSHYYMYIAPWPFTSAKRLWVMSAPSLSVTFVPVR